MLHAMWLDNMKAKGGKKRGGKKKEKQVMSEQNLWCITQLVSLKLPEAEDKDVR